MPISQLSLDIGYYELDSEGLANSNLTNLYVYNPETEGALSTGALFRTPGITLEETMASSNCRGFYILQKDGDLYAVYGTTLYKKTSLGGSFSSIGTIVGTGRVYFASNGITMVIIVPGNTGYFYTVSSGLAEINDPVFDDMKLDQGGVTSVCLKDNRFIYNSDIYNYLGSVATVNDGQDFDALDFEDAEVSSDPIIRSMTIKNELYVFGTETIELYQAGTGDYPYDRIQGATIDKGLKSRAGVIEFDNSYVYLGQGPKESPAIWKGTSGSATKLSTAAIDATIGSYTDEQLSTVSCWTYTQEGHFFVGWNFPNETFVYDATASAAKQRPVWHERQTGGTVWSVEDCITIFGMVYVGDTSTANFGSISRDNLDEYGTAITRTFTGSYLQNLGQSFSLSSVELKTRSGYGTSSGAGSNPTVEMLSSIDGGNTFNSNGTKSLGIQNDFKKRQIWRRLGRVPHNIILRFTTSDPIATDFYRLDVEVK